MESKVAKRREARMAGIIEFAWKLAREQGIAGVSLHALARQVGVRQPSLYEYFDSKIALYDAMFADGNRQLIERLDALELPREPRAALKRFLSVFTAFGLEESRPLRTALPKACARLHSVGGLVHVGTGSAGPGGFAHTRRRGNGPGRH